MSMGPNPLQHRYTQAWLCRGRFGQVPSDVSGDKIPLRVSRAFVRDP